MWTPSYHQFAARGDFLAACDAAGWPRDHLGAPAPPASVAVDEVGVLGGAGWHVNMAWHARDPDPAFAASTIAPVTPSRIWAGG